VRFASDDEGGIGAARTVMMMAHNEIKISLNMMDEGGREFYSHLLLKYNLHGLL
jgi:hypothetical protein